MLDTGCSILVNQLESVIPKGSLPLLDKVAPTTAKILTG
jgi:hypothetical protein